MKPEFFEVRHALDECPKCGKPSLAQSGSDRYHCLWCGFYRDISEPEGIGTLVIAAILATVLVVLLGNQTNSSPNNLSFPDSSNAPAVKVSPN